MVDEEHKCKELMVDEEHKCKGVMVDEEQMCEGVMVDEEHKCKGVMVDEEQKCKGVMVDEEHKCKGVMVDEEQKCYLRLKLFSAEDIDRDTLMNPDGEIRKYQALIWILNLLVLALLWLEKLEFLCLNLVIEFVAALDLLGETMLSAQA
ncbi:hypothetical protein Adt_10812 [Abeliophyllum distichum]|uniref:Uncharacterized protein n=1 Tax=Abeliophyllum distichum TaxID=126358 RepID=A0ABD1UM25_9LAMI